MRLDPSMLGAPKHERVENDFYGTIDEDCTTVLMDWLADNRIGVEGSVVWEPANGQGHMSNVIRRYGPREMILSDIAPQLPDTVPFDFLGNDDFSEFTISEPQFIITNPPYQKEILDGFLAKCVEYSRDYGITCALLVRKEVDSAVTRHKFFAGCKQHMASINLLWRPRWIVGSTGSPRHNYVWHVWSPYAGNRPAEIHYVKRPKK